MQDQQPRRIPIAMAVVLSVLTLAGAATAWWNWNSMTTPEQDSTPTAIQPTPPESVVRPSVKVAPPAPLVPAPVTPKPVQPSRHSQNLKSPVKRTVQVYWLKDTGRDIQLAPKQVTVESPTDKPSVALEAAFSGLLAGPDNSKVATTIPDGTKLRSVAIQEDGVHVDLSQEFTTGGGSASMTGRVAQILYTATTLEPSTQVWIAVEGRPLEVLGGEGVELNQPITRQSFENDFTL